MPKEIQLMQRRATVCVSWLIALPLVFLQARTSGIGALSATLGLAALQSILLAASGCVAQPTAQFAASPISWRTLLHESAAVAPFLQEMAPERESSEGNAVRTTVQEGQPGAPESSKVWPADPEARLQSLTDEVADAAASIIGRKVEANEPLMAAGAFVLFDTKASNI